MMMNGECCDHAVVVGKSNRDESVNKREDTPEQDVELFSLLDARRMMVVPFFIYFFPEVT